MVAIFVGGKLNRQKVEVSELTSLEDFSGRYAENYKGCKGCCPREELWDKPIINGYLSPMWDGGMLRYETQDVYDLLSN